MATKWKNFTRSCWVKAAACLLILVLTGVSAWQIVVFYMYTSDNEDAAQLLDSEMLFSDKLPDREPLLELYSATYHLTQQAALGDADYIEAGQAIDYASLCTLLYDKFNDAYYTNTAYEENDAFESSAHIITIYPKDDTAAVLENTPSTDDIVTNVAANNELRDEYAITSEELPVFRSWLEANPGVITVCQQEIINNQLADLNSWQQMSSSSLSKVDYYIYNKQTNTTLSNISTTTKAHMSTKTYPFLCSLNSNHSLQFESQEPIDPQIMYGFEFDYYTGNDGDVVLVGLSNSTVESMEKAWIDAAGHFRQFALILLASGIGIILCLIVLICGAGRTTADDAVHLIWFDRVWTEVQATFSGIILLPLLVAVSPPVVTLPTQVLYIAVIGAFVAVAAVWLAVLLSQIRRIKVKQWLNGWIIWRLLYKYGGHAVRWLGKCLRSLHRRFRKTPLHRKLILICILAPLACAFWITIPFIIAGALYFGMRAADRFELVCNGAHNIRAGETDTRITINGGSKEMQALADDLNGISDGLNEAVSTAVKSERLKSELISNVSHDIKTPLTSIITYIDLLKRCDIPDPAAQEYINTLDQKAKRLQTLTLDLFDASKATSGAMQVDLAKTDFDALLRQALGERSDHLEKAGLDVRVQSQPLTYVRADGRLLWRILDNLLSNCARYALPNSRVYIALNPENEKVVLTIKNISAVELNIPADDLMQRFTRGDRSRHTEGSGLGLSIAQSLAELMSGTCQVEIDGDLFKASVAIPKWEEA